MGAQAPVPSGTGSVNYRDVGTNIDCFVRPAGDGRFQVSISIEETSVYAEDGIDQAALEKFANMPVFRSYQSSNTVVLAHGQSARFTTAVDRITGETVAAEVTLTVLK